MNHPTPHQVAQRPGRLDRFRLVPLVLLVLCVVAATLVGRVGDWSDAAATPGAGAAAAKPKKPPKAKTSLPRVCTPTVAQRLRGREPWRDPKLAPASERKFARNIAQEAPAYVEGRDGWLFWNDWQVNDMSQSIGRLTLDKAGIKRWSRYLRGLQRDAEAAGSDFYVVVAPAKWDVYPKLLPGWARTLRGSVSLDLLMRAQPKIPFIDTRKALRESAAKTYEPLDSHWTPYGGYVAWKAVTRCLRAVDQGTPYGVPKAEGVDRVADSNEFAPQGIEPGSRPMRTVPDYVRPLPEMVVRQVGSGRQLEVGDDNIVDGTLMPATTTTADAQTDQRLLVLRDSTGGALSPLWGATFASTAQYSHGLGTTGPFPDVTKLARKHRADITMIVLTERYLGYQPPA